MRIIKDAKITREPVVIVMHQFDDLVDAQDILRHETDCDLEPVTMKSPMNDERDMKPAISSANEQAAEAAEKILQAARKNADDLLAVAAQEADRLKNSAQTEAESLKQQALLDGIQQGLAEAKLQMAEQVKQAADQCNAIIEAANREAQQMVLGADRQIVELVLAIARKIIMDEMEERTDVILGVVREALERVKDQDRINVHVSLDDYEQILQARNVLQGIVGLEKIVTVTADAVLSRGGCLIETSFGTVEAGLDSQLESIRKALKEMLP